MSLKHDRIRLTGLSAHGFHGVLAAERAEGQLFVADVELRLGTAGTALAAATDDLSHTVDYGSVASAVVDVIEGEPVNLVETLAARIADAVLAFDGVVEVEVTLHKPQAPLEVAFDDVTLTIVRSRTGAKDDSASPHTASSLLEQAEATAADALVTPSPAAAVASEPEVDLGLPILAPVAIAPVPVPEPVAAVAPVPVPEPIPSLPDATPVPSPAEAPESHGEFAAATSEAEQESAEELVHQATDEAAEGILPAAGEGIEQSENHITGEAEEELSLLDARPDRPAAVVLALGGNVGGVVPALRKAVHELSTTEGVVVTGVAPLARTAAVLLDGAEPQPDYLNTVVLLETTLSPREVLHVCQGLENAAGRVRLVPKGPRTLDIDVITYEGVRSTDPELTLPHPAAAERAFVLVPWAQIDPFAEIGDAAVAALADEAPDRAGVRWLALDWLDSDHLPALPTGQYVAPPVPEELSQEHAPDEAQDPSSADLEDAESVEQDEAAALGQEPEESAAAPELEDIPPAPPVEEPAQADTPEAPADASAAPAAEEHSASSVLPEPEAAADAPEPPVTLAGAAPAPEAPQSASEAPAPPAEEEQGEAAEVEELPPVPGEDETEGEAAASDTDEEAKGYRAPSLKAAQDNTWSAPLSWGDVLGNQNGHDA